MYIGAFSGYSSNAIDECKAFYQDVLGLDIDERMGGFSYEVAGQSVFVYPKEDHEPATFTVFNFVVNNIDEAHAELSDKGVEFTNYDSSDIPQDEEGILRGKAAGYGPNIAWFHDPSGNILSIVEN